MGRETTNGNDIYDKAMATTSGVAGQSQNNRFSFSADTFVSGFDPATKEVTLVEAGHSVRITLIDPDAAVTAVLAVVDAPSPVAAAAWLRNTAEGPTEVFSGLPTEPLEVYCGLGCSNVYLTLEGATTGSATTAIVEVL